MGDFEQIPEISAAVVARSGHEVVLPYSRAVELIKICSAHQIAVLGVELFLPAGDQFQACGCSTYDPGENKLWPRVEDEATWMKYVEWNNAEAESFVEENPLSEDYSCIFTTVSMTEYRKLLSSPVKTTAKSKSKFRVGSFFRFNS